MGLIDDILFEADAKLAIDVNDRCQYILEINFYMEFAADWILFWVFEGSSLPFIAASKVQSMCSSMYPCMNLY